LGGRNSGGGGLCEANSLSFGGGWGEATAAVSAFSFKAYTVIPNVASRNEESFPNANFGLNLPFLENIYPSVCN